MRATYWVWRRELAVMLRAPILYVVGGLFLVVQGVAFAGLVGALSDPRRPAPLGALFEGQLAGTLLTWVLELVVLTLLGMRAIADDKRTGSWEALLTAGVGEGAAVIGKWLAAVAIYAVVWLPTLAYLGLVALYRADAGGWDAPAIALGYVGAIAIGAALIAWAIAASAATGSLLAAGALGFAWLICLFLVGELPSLWPDLAVDHPALAGGLGAVSLRAIATDFARGQLAWRSVIVLAGLTIVGLSLAITLACAGRRRRREVRVRAAGTVVLAVIGALAGVVAGRLGGVDLSAAHRNSLADATRDVLRALPAPATLTIVEPTLGALEPVYDEVARVADRIADAAPAVAVRRVDPAHAPGGLPAIARGAGLGTNDLAAGGAVVVELAGKQRVIDLLSFAVIDQGPGGAPIVEQLAIEQALAGALAALAMPRPITVCATRGAGEMAWQAPAVPPGASAPPPGLDWAMVGQRLVGDGMTLDSIDVSRGVPARCTVVVVAGPTSSLGAEAALALDRFVRAGGGLIVAIRADDDLHATGLDGVLADHGLHVEAAITFDPSHAVRELPGARYVIDGYADHPINRGFADKRLTLWVKPVAIVVDRGAAPLVSAKRADAGPVALAAISADHRVLALGSAEAFSSRVLALGASANDLWLARAIRFVAGVEDPGSGTAARAPDQVRLVMTGGERRAVIALSVAGIPLAWAIVGGAIVWWRRRRSR